MIKTWPFRTGWDVYWARVAGQHISMGGTYSWLAHADAIDSTTIVTDQTGAVVWDQVFGPWGQTWQQTGTRPCQEGSGGTRSSLLAKISTGCDRLVRGDGAGD
ncbi:MAG TPA: hypothetical protein VNM47_15565 [Terriglobia bacterium]|nr:hypothetical protein [Terriglobia bacterium]